MAKNIHHQMGKVLRTLMFEGKIDARMICDLTYSTTPSRRIADLREVFKGSSSGLMSVPNPKGMIAIPWNCLPLKSNCSKRFRK